MKRVVIAVLLLFSAVSVSVWSNITFENNMKDFSYLLQSLIAHSEKSEDNVLKNETQKLVDKSVENMNNNLYNFSK